MVKSIKERESEMQTEEIPEAPKPAVDPQTPDDAEQPAPAPATVERTGDHDVKDLAWRCGAMVIGVTGDALTMQRLRDATQISVPLNQPLAAVESALRGSGWLPLGGLGGTHA